MTDIAQRTPATGHGRPFPLATGEEEGLPSSAISTDRKGRELDCRAATNYPQQMQSDVAARTPGRPTLPMNMEINKPT